MNTNMRMSRRLQDLMREVTAKGHSLFSAESVGRGHPDKIADQVSDCVLDSYLGLDPDARVAVETSCKDSLIALTGEVSHRGPMPNLTPLIRDLITKDIGFNRDDLGLNGNTCTISLTLGGQSSEIAQGTREAGVGDDDGQGAGDQGTMFGYATNETPEMMPMAHMLASKMVRGLNQLMDQHPELGLRPDNKSQITLERGPDGAPLRIAVVVVAQQHDPDVGRGPLEELVRRLATQYAPGMVDEDTIFIVNGTGSFILGGPHGDAGLTGRKIIVDTYGGAARHGGGAFSGKDPSKVDRSGAYMARYLAKQVIGNGYAARCEVQLGYCIGIASPVSLMVNTFGSSLNGANDQDLTRMILEGYDLRPAAIIRQLGLKKIRYLPTATYGHFGWAEYPWEQVQKF